ncbi:MAG: hypothetical protein GY913_35530 [Proteobacteria bacterium]|nr:hypothetical protein [Pseudomonadota bacterium]MCP4922244.1 hypothetical protein [Pseudomonadota bacterium]
MDVTIEILTFKEGLLSRVAHDLKLSVVGGVVIEDDGSARIDPRSIRVVHAMNKGAPDLGALSDGDKRKIEKSMRADVLHVGRYPEIRFVPTSADQNRLAGHLHLHGARRAIELVFQDGEARVRLHQPDFGIKPFSAMMGALKVKPGVEVRVTRT